jgi:hypothetical protein
MVFQAWLANAAQPFRGPGRRILVALNLTAD